MDSLQTPLPDDDRSPSPSAPGELVVQNGRQTGVRRPLLTPLTLIGRAPGCDLRLNVDPVSPHHCVISPSASGLILRDLGSEAGTLVNDHRTEGCVLKDGDVLTVGPFRLLVRCPQPVTAQDPSGEPNETDALRVQAAAVAAQQAALLEEENRLQQRKLGLEKQEEQLAAYLEERRQELVDLKEQVRQQRSLLQKERGNLDQERRDRLGEAERDRAEAGQVLAGARQERLRLSALRRRLRRRWKKQWLAQERDLKGREKAVANKDRFLDDERKALLIKQASLTQARLKINGERELNRCELREEWQKLHQAQQVWKCEKQGIERDLAGEKQRLNEQARSLQESRETLEAWRLEAQMMRDQLIRESQGLENRVQNLRSVLQQVEAGEGRPVVQPDLLPITGDSGLPILDARTQGWLGQLESLAGMLADQRLVLVEHWQHFLLTQEQWRQEQESMLRQLEDSTRELDDRQQLLDQREWHLHAREVQESSRQQALAHMRQVLEAGRARLQVGETAWKHERMNLLGQVEHAQESARHRAEKLDALRRQWSARRKTERERMTRELQRSSELQRLYTTLREDCENRGAELSALQRTLQERQLALEQLELDRQGRSEDAVAEEKNLQKLRKQYANMYAEAEQRLAERSRSLEEEAQRLASQNQNLHRRLESVTEAEATLSTRQAEWEHRQMKEQETREELQHQLEGLHAQQMSSAKRCQELQDELDRLVALMLEDAKLPGEALRAA